MTDIISSLQTPERSHSGENSLTSPFCTTRGYRQGEGGEIGHLVMTGFVKWQRHVIGASKNKCMCALSHTHKIEQNLPSCAAGWSRCGSSLGSRPLIVRTAVCINTSPGFPCVAQPVKPALKLANTQQSEKTKKPVMSACSLC